MSKYLIQDTINIIPCFNEKKSWKTPKWLPFPRYISSFRVTPENYSARPNIVAGQFSKEVPWELAGCSDKNFYEIADIMKVKKEVKKEHGPTVPDEALDRFFGGEEEEKLNRCNFDNRLDYLSTTTWGAQKKCDDVKLKPFWDNLAKHIRTQVVQQQQQRQQQQQQQEQQQQRAPTAAAEQQRLEGIYNFIIVGHHNRMRKQFLPLRDEKKGYANCFCVKMVVGDVAITPEVVFHGFPDKSDYNYVMDTDKDWLDEKSWGDIKKILEEHIGQLGIIANLYFIRHGNALHNKPLGVKKPDSPLTPVGLYQASYLGARLRDRWIPNEGIYCTLRFLSNTLSTNCSTNYFFLVLDLREGYNR